MLLSPVTIPYGLLKPLPRALILEHLGHLLFLSHAHRLRHKLHKQLFVNGLLSEHPDGEPQNFVQLHEWKASVAEDFADYRIGLVVAGQDQAELENVRLESGQVTIVNEDYGLQDERHFVEGVADHFVVLLRFRFAAL